MKEAKRLFNKAVHKLGMMFPPILFLVITFFIYIPCSLFLGNIDEFAISFNKVVPIVAKVSIAASFFMMILGFVLVWKKAFKVYIALIFGIALGFYIQGNFLNPDFGILNGKDIVWSDYDLSGMISAAAYFICIAVPVVLIFWKEKIAQNIIRWGSLMLCTMQVVALAAAVITSPEKEAISFAILKKDQFLLSSKQNTIVFVVDTLDTEYYEEIIESDNRYASHLKDFTYYDNCVTGGAPTVCAIPLMLTGQGYNDLSVNFSDYQVKAYQENNLFRDLKKNDYKVNLFTEFELVFGISNEEVDNYLSSQEYVIESETGFAKQLYQFTSFYAMPLYLKKYFWFYSDDFTQYIGLKDSEYSSYTFDDAKFYKEYKEQGITTTNDSKVFTYYHLRGSHPPYIIDENCELVGEGKSSRRQQTQGIFKMIFEYIDEMKAKGIYDESTIIITADHGENELYQSAAILVKERNAHHEYITDSSPVMFKNLYASFAALSFDNAEKYGETLEQVTDEPRERLHSCHRIARNYYRDDADISESEFSQFLFKGNTREMDQVSKVSTSNKPQNMENDQ